MSSLSINNEVDKEEETTSQNKSNDQESDNFTEYIVMNPAFHSNDGCTDEEKEQQDINPPNLTNENLYEIMTGNNHLTPSSPSHTNITRKTTINTLYNTRRNTVHPTSLRRNNQVLPSIYNEEVKKPKSRCLLLTCLFSLIVTSLILAILALVLVSLLWLGVYVPDTVASTCSVRPSVTEEAQSFYDVEESSITRLRPSPSVPCLCPIPTDVISWIEEKSSNITELMNDIKDEIDQLHIQSDQSLVNQTNSIRLYVSEINSTCHETLVNLTSQNVSLAGLEFGAELRNVGVYSNCVYEYLSNCTMDVNEFNCSTSFHDVLVEGYYNLDTSCHFYVKPKNGIPKGGVDYPLLSNLHMRPQQGQGHYFHDNADTQFLLAKSKMRCDCALIQYLPNGMVWSRVRHNVVTCALHRMRCPTINTFNNVLIKKAP